MVRDELALSDLFFATRRSVSNRLPQISLRMTMVVAIALVALVAVALVGFVSQRQGRVAVNDVAGQLASEIAARIHDHLVHFLKAPVLVNAENAQALVCPGMTDPESIERHFQNQVRMFSSVSSISFGNDRGGLVNSGRDPIDGSKYVIVTEGFAAGAFRKFAAHESGKRGDLLTELSHFDARNRSWYVKAVEAGGPVWSDIYVLFTGQDMTISLSRPLFNENGALLGVTTADIFLSQIGAFLEGLEIGKSGLAFVFERSGLLVATSERERPFILADGAGERLAATNSQSPFVREAVRVLLDQNDGDLYGVTDARMLFTAEGERCFSVIRQVRDQYGIDWLIGVVVPESDFTAAIESGNRWAFLIMASALVLALAIGLIITRRISGPLLLLNASARLLSRGEEPPAMPEDGPIREIAELGHSFNRMAARLRTTMDGLNREVAERRQAEELMRESEERYRSLFENNHVVMLIVDPETGDVVEANPAAEEYYGWSRETLTAKKIFEINTAEPETIRARMAEAARMGSHNRFEFRHRLADGQIRDVEVFSGPIVREGRRALYSIIHDISVRRRAESEREELQQQLHQSQKLQAVGTLAGGVAHDFNNLLQAIGGFTQVLLRRNSTSQGDRVMLKTIERSVDRAAQLVRRLLLFSRKAEARRAPIDLNRAVRDASKILERTISRMVRIEFRLAENAWPILADPVQLEQVLLNLGINSADAMPGGGIMTIGTENVVFYGGSSSESEAAGLRGSYVRLTVADTGVGMDQETMDHMYDPFFTTKALDKGTGLGLASVYGIVKGHGGAITCQSGPGRGTTFDIYLPAEKDKEPEPQDVADDVPQAGGGPETVLVVDDEEDIREVSTMVLEEHGYTVLTAESGEQALEVFASNRERIDLVMLDLGMPGMGGHRCLQSLLEMDPGVRVLVASGYSATGLIRDTMEAGAADYITKPYRIEELLSKIREILGAGPS
ncbi:MAG: response regulator [Deltaproteobacteria bacterium]|nr:response regulator [Deltaproteobacteria bacterium]